MDGPKSLPVVMPAFPVASPFDEQFQAVNRVTAKPAPLIPFTITTASGETLQGVTDKDGKTPRIFGRQSESLELTWGGLREEGLMEDLAVTKDQEHDGC
jgi:uncharacterized protein (DUF2345 family)